MKGLIKLCVFSASVALLSGCGIEAGDYVVYRVSVSAPSLSAGCYYPDEDPPPNEAEDSDSYGQSQTWVVYRGTDDRLVLDAAGVAHGGSDSDEGYRFESNDIDVTYVGIDQQEAKVTLVTEVVIDLLVDDAAISGQHVTRASTKCDFLTATPSPGLCEDIPDCVRSRTVAGVVLEEVELTSDVDPPNP